MARRRKIMGQRLLAATSAVAMGCGIGVSGNLVAPPMVELCLDVEPADAMVTVDGSDWSGIGDTGTGETCVGVFEGAHDIVVTADGYEEYRDTVVVDESTTLEITLTPSE